MIRKPKKPFIRDVFLAELTKDAKRTRPDGYPIIEEWMVAEKPPKELFQWDRRYDVTEPEKSGMSFYCNDSGFIPILNNPQGYTDKLRVYECIVGIDPSPYDNMPLVVQKSQIYNNLAITYYYGKQGLKIIPNVRLGNNETIGSLSAYPKGTLIAIGTHGFTKKLENRQIFKNQVSIAVEEIRPSGIIVYGPVSEYIFQAAISKEIPIYQYDSYTMKQNAKDKAERKNKQEGKNHERV
ncbi:protein of unknown function [Pseudobutyrivibrio sp. ACV-2]|uniref:DUF4417 domain-containing protein n=1 Tax=Pseudobutyrivibrio sp. ACV-2 TaxID=1520801 RepID=UPI000896F6A5|nr:DUF4417 domain-containing protein [Pseudobutyrivibrio sp. ACV-2]SEB01806.1 protein of unknown function [Pseudobutyrivibrio sp. ACV-2]